MSLRIGAILEQPFSYPCAFDSHCPHRGYGVEVAILVCNFLNITCTFSWFNSSAYGDVDENGTASGLIGAIANDQYDTGLPILTPTFRRSKAVSFSALYFYTGVLFVTRAPENQTIDRLGYAFQWPIWCALIILFFLTAFWLVAIRKKLPYEKIKNQSYLFILTDLSISLITNDFRISITKLNSIRIIIIFWSSASVVLISAYTSLLFSQEIVQNNQLPFTDLNTFFDCLAKDRCRIVVPTMSSSITQLLQGSINNHDQALNEKSIQIVPEDEIPRRIFDEKNIYLVWPASKGVYAYLTQNNQHCKFYTIDAPYKDLGAFAVRKDKTEILAKFDDLAAYLQGAGLTEYIESKYLSNGSDLNECRDRGPSMQKQKYIPFLAMTSTFTFYGVAMSLKILILILELIIDNGKKFVGANTLEITLP